MAGNSVVDLICSIVNIDDAPCRPIFSPSLVEVIMGANIGRHRADERADVP
jgi:hypothetical protein